jgi:hypothetical protein
MRNAIMRRIASSKIEKGQPETDWTRRSLPRARRRRSRRGGVPGLRYRAGLRPPQSERGGALAARVAEQQEHAWEIEEVVDNFPEEIAVLPEELRVIETFLASVLDETFEQLGSETETAAIDTTKFAVQEHNNR